MKLKYLNTNEKLVFYSLDNVKLAEVPLFGNSVPAGFPSPAEDYLDMDLNLHEYLVQNPSLLKYLKY